MNKSIFIVGGIIGLVAILGVVAYNDSMSDNASSQQESQESTHTEQEEINDRPERTAPAGWAVYMSEDYDFSLFYPEALHVTEYKEGDYARTIAFEDAESGLGFQIFIVPYYEEMITDERFRMDTPSGVRENIRDGVVGGTKATFFHSRHQLLGETSEAWFITEPYLYEVTTLRPLEEWLYAILKTWHFEK